MNLSRSSARLDAVLHQFEVISTAEEPYGYGGSYPSDSPRKPNFPSLYLSRSTDKGLMKMQGEGTALVNYKIKSRSIDENGDDGMPLYGASIEIRSIAPVAGEVEEESELSETLFLREFAGGWKDENSYGVDAAGRGMTVVAQKEKGIKAHFKRNAGKYAGVLAGGVGGGVLAHAGQNVGLLHAGLLGGGLVGKGVDSIRENQQIKRVLKKDLAPKEQGKNLSSPLFLRHFAVARDRDGEGRYSAGNVPGADDYAIAGAMAPKKKMGLGKKVAIGAGAGLAAGALGGGVVAMRKSAALQGGFRDALLRGASRAR